MKPELKQKWIEALRSGKYEQARGALRTGNAFCCLGVLADIAYPDAWEPAQVMPGCYEVHGKEQMLSEADLEQLGLDCDYATELAERNDAGERFDEIARSIEVNL